MRTYTISFREYRDYDLCVMADSREDALQQAHDWREADGLDNWTASDPDETDMHIVEETESNQRKTRP